MTWCWATCPSTWRWGGSSAVEHATRAEEALRARTHGELGRVTADLPEVVRPRDPVSAAERAGLAVHAAPWVLTSLAFWLVLLLGQEWAIWPALGVTFGWGWGVVAHAGDTLRWWPRHQVAADGGSRRALPL